MSNNNYCEYRKEGRCVSPDGKIMSCSIDIDNIYRTYAKENAVRMCPRKHSLDSQKSGLETKV